VILFVSRERELAFFPHRDERSFQLECGRGSENEAAGVDTYDGINGAGTEAFGEQVNAAGEQARVAQDRRNIFELHSGAWKIRDVPNGRSDLGRANFLLHRKLDYNFTASSFSIILRSLFKAIF